MGANGSTFDDKAQVKLPLHKYANMKLSDFDDLWNRFKESGLGFALTPIECGELLVEKNYRELKKLFNVFDTDEKGLVDAFELIVTLALCSSMRLNEKLTFIQTVYDFNENSMFSKDEITIIARTALYGIAKADEHLQTTQLETSSMEQLADRCYEFFSVDEDNEISGEQLVEFCSRDAEALQFVTYCNGLLAPEIVRDGSLYTDRQWKASGEKVYHEPILPPLGTLLPEGLEWKSLTQLCSPKPVLFADGVQPTVAIPGNLSNEWFLDACNMLLVKPWLLTRLFVPTSQEDLGRYCVRFWKDGDWKRVVVDDLVPCDSFGDTLYAKGEDRSQVWPYLIEKAYAKLHGNYETLKQDSVDYALTDLTGGRVARVPLKSQYEGIEKHELWDQMEDMMIRGIIGCSHCSSRATSFETAKACRAGVVVGHTYSIVDLIDEGRGEKFVRLRSRQLPREWREGRRDEEVGSKVSGSGGTLHENGGAKTDEGKVADTNTAWKDAIDEDGNKYWFNEETEEKTYDDPAKLEGKEGKNEGEGSKEQGETADSKANRGGMGDLHNRTFLVSFDSFVTHMNMLRYVYLWGEEWITQRKHGEWLNRRAGGAPHEKTWLRNQQFALEVFDEKGAEVCIELFQPDGRYHGSSSLGYTDAKLSQKFLGDTSTYDAAIGMLVVKHDWGGPGVDDGKVNHLRRLIKDDIVELTFPFQFGRSVRFGPKKLEQGKYIVIPMTYKPNFFSKYVVIARSKRREIEFADYLDMPWDDLPGDDIDDDYEDEKKASDHAENDEEGDNMTVVDVGKELVETVPNADRFARPIEKEDEYHFDPEYKNIACFHRIIWKYYTEVANLRQRRTDLSNRLKVLEQ